MREMQGLGQAGVHGIDDETQRLWEACRLLNAAKAQRAINAGASVDAAHVLAPIDPPTYPHHSCLLQHPKPPVDCLPCAFSGKGTRVSPRAVWRRMQCTMQDYQECYIPTSQVCALRHQAAHASLESPRRRRVCGRHSITSTQVRRVAERRTGMENGAGMTASRGRIRKQMQTETGDASTDSSHQSETRRLRVILYCCQPITSHHSSPPEHF